MKKLQLPVLVACLLSSSLLFSQNENFDMRQLACGLSQPWEITIGPDGYLWVTEAHSYQISRVDPQSGATSLLIDLSDKKNFPNFNEAEEWPQGGLQGMAFHPNFASFPYFYVAYVHQFDGCLPDTMGCYFKTKIVRYDYDLGTQTLSNETVIIDTIPGSTDHNGGRLAIGPISEGMDYLFYSVGDMRAGHLGNAARPHHGQSPEYYEGKILRFNLVPDSDPDYFDSWIPNNNPFNTQDEQSAVWSLGHRNPQGLVFSPEGILYQSEHGPYSDDEINIIKQSYNYGFPLIMGFTDGNYDGSKAGAGSGLPWITSEAANRTAIESEFLYSEPIESLFDAPQSEVSTLFTNDINNTPPFDNYYLQYPTTALSGIDYYSSDAIPGWKNSLLVANLKLANVYRLPLNNDGTAVVGDTIAYFQGLGRFRDLAISPDGMKIYVAADSNGVIKGAPGEAVEPPNKGCILEFAFNPTGTFDNSLHENIKLYPNPSNGGNTTLRVDLQEEATVAVDLFASTGQKIATIRPLQKTKSFEQTIGVQQYQPGVYFLKIQVNDATTVSELLIVE